MNLRYGIVGFLAAIFAITAIFLFDYNRQDTSVLRPSTEISSIIESATSIETYRVNTKWLFGSRKIGGYFIVEQGLNPSDKAMQRIKALLEQTGRQVANLVPQSKCVQNPGVAFRFIENEKSVELLICFECQESMVANDVNRQWLSFTPQRDELVKITKALFPNNSKIQQLPDKYAS